MAFLDDEERDAITSWLRSPTAPQAGVYRLSALGAVAAFLAAMTAGGLEIDGKENGAFYFRDRAYYEVVAQVLPVLFLTFAVERRFFQPSRTQAASVGALVAFGFVVVTAVVAELCVLVVVGIRDAPPTLMQWATQSSAAGITGALILIAGQAALDSGLLKVLANVIESPSDHLAREQSFWMVAGVVVGVPFSIAVIWANYVHNTANVRQMVFVGGTLLAIALWLRVSIAGGKVITRLLWWFAAALREMVRR